MVPDKSVWPKVIAHADMDAYYAAIEQLDDPSLRGKPVLVGSPTNRGVVLTASYEARPFGVGSAMPMVKARRMCPDAVIARPRLGRYQEISKLIMGVFADFSPDVEAISLDEAFLDLSGCEQLLGEPPAIGRKLKETVREVTGGLTVSVGISATKYVAKVASAYQKPDGLTIVPPSEAQTWLAPLPVSRLWGVGPKTEKRLHALHLHTIRDVAAASPGWLEDKLGSAGRQFYALAHATDPRTVEGRRTSKSIGSERTLAENTTDKNEIRRFLRLSAEEIGRRLRRQNYVASGVRVKLKTNKFQILTRQHQRGHPTDVTDQLYADACMILDALQHAGPFRLVGLTAFDLVSADKAPQLDLFGEGADKRRLDVAVDELKQRFGSNILKRADDMSRLQEPPNLDLIRDTDDCDDT